jgi:hydrogenase 3 maturation protease
MDGEIQRAVVCGIGNRVRGDDAIGPLVIDSLKDKEDDENILLLSCESVPESFLGTIADFGPDKVILIDAVDFGKKPGTVDRVDMHTVKQLNLSTHKMPLTLFVDYLQKKIKFRLVFIGFQPKSIRLGDEISPECKKSVESIKSMVLQDLGIG